MSAFSSLLYVIRSILDYLKRKARRNEQSSAQEQRDQVEDDPSAWFGEHFDGVRDESDAGQANKADDNAQK